MKVKYRLSEHNSWKYVITAKGIEFPVNISHGELCIDNLNNYRNLSMSRIESAFASIRGFFAHKKNMDKLLSLSNKIHIFSTPSRRSYFYDADVSRECDVPDPMLRTCSSQS